MNRISLSLLTCFCLLSITNYAQPDSIVLRDISWDKNSKAGMTELFIPSAGTEIAGFIYTANGCSKASHIDHVAWFPR